jgi:hypothetical protein
MSAGPTGVVSFAPAKEKNRPIVQGDCDVGRVAPGTIVAARIRAVVAQASHSAAADRRSHRRIAV